MKLISYRSGWSVEGEFVAVLPKDAVPSDNEMLAYFHLRPGDARFADHARSSRFDRVVLRKHNSNFVIVPCTGDISKVTS